MKDSANLPSMQPVFASLKSIADEARAATPGKISPRTKGQDNY